MRTAQRVIDAGQATGYAIHSMTIHTPDGDVSTMRVLDIHETADFVGSYRPEILVQAVVTEGAYLYKLIPHLSSLEVTMTRDEYKPMKAFETIGRNKQIRRYKAILLNAQDSELSQEGITNVSERTSDLGSLTNVKFQLFTEMTEQFRMRSSGGIYRRQPVGNVIRAILLGESAQVDVGSDDEIAGFEMVEPVDAPIREHISIPHGIPSYDAPGYIHRFCGGVYPTGLSYYCYQDTWYVFPTYDFTRFNESKHQLTLVLAPPKALPMIEFTAMQVGTAVTIVCTGDVVTNNVSDRNELEQGNGLRFADPESLVGNGVSVSGNKATFSRGAANNELVSNKRPNGLNYVKLADNAITSNRLYELSKLAARRGQMIAAQWENSDSRLLKPGMQIKLMHMQGNLVRTRRGVLIGYTEGTIYTGTGMTSGQYVTNCNLVLFLENESEQ